MVKGKFVLLSFLAAALLCWQFLPMNTPTASSGIVNACSSSTWFYDAVGTRCLIVCPQGDGTTLESGSNRIALIARDNLGIPIEGILATDV
ncbi:MAG: hypothetical protein GTO51_09830, partial [Candidatus Latescibacteria bacterium]|nr:hypothetical protein [Candidatus Latescibacterota bacterium]NIM22228.1 hypothetical protein [Candidatus Latescibacterota bacterium]NIM66267.1 hypothetical protein [Candidatus Latescibacterota bacterium]NIO02344.1 hypothetical protein [Candidatus Latescibacterota bacterium]NIO29875.1 hypothetical protein [Candidatus Latescibacterota bacterium]